MAIVIGDQVNWDIHSQWIVYEIYNGGTTARLRRVDNPEESTSYGLERLLAQIHAGRVEHIPKSKIKSKIKTKKKGHEMQHCPFCMAAWLNEDLTKPQKRCKYCGAGLM